MSTHQIAVPEPKGLQISTAAESVDARFYPGEERPEGLNELLGLLWRRKVLFATLFLVLLAAAGVEIVLISPAYTASALLDLDPRQPQYSGLPNVLNTAPENPDFNLDLVRSEIFVLSSEGLARRVIEALDLENNQKFLPPKGKAWALFDSLLPWRAEQVTSGESRLEAATHQYAKDLNLFNDGKSFVIEASFTTGTPELAQRVLAKQIELYLADQRAFKQTTVARSQHWLVPELARLKDKLQSSEQQLQAYRNTHHLTRTSGETAVGRQFTDLTAQLGPALSDLAHKVARQTELTNGAQDTLQLGSETISRLRQEEAAASEKLAGMRSRFGNNSPFLIAPTAALADLSHKIALEQNRMREAASKDVDAARYTVTRLKEQVSQLEQQVGLTRDADLVVASLQSEVDAERNLYNALLGQQQQVDAQYSIQDADVRVVSPPLAPQQPSFPRHGLLGVIAACASALLAGLLVLVLERCRGESRSLSDIERNAGLTGLGSIPRLRRQDLRRWPPVLEPLTQCAASIQALINSVAFHAGGTAPRVIAIVSAVPGEGKTTVAALLAISLAQSGVRVLLVDADMRRRGLSRRLDCALATGLIGLLEQGGPLAQAVIRHKASNLDILPAERGYSNPYRFARAGALSRVLGEARSQYDAVVIDTPPMAAVDDALPFSAAADATIVVASWGSTPFDALRGAAQRVRLAGARNVGVALNRVPRRGQAYQPGLECVRGVSPVYFSARA